MTPPPKKRRSRSRSKKPRSSAEGAPLSQGKLNQNLEKTLLQFMEGRRFKPMSQEELIERLSIPGSLKAACKDILTQLIVKGEIHVDKNLLSLKKVAEETMTGTVRMHARGFGFVIPDDATEHPQDIFIPKHLVNNAIDGDRVEVVINRESVSEKGPEGKIHAIIERAREHLAGTVREQLNKAEYLVYAPLLGMSKPVIARGDALKVGDRVILKVSEWGAEKEPTIGEVTHVIGNIADAATDIEAAIEEFDLRSGFPKAAILQAKKYGKTVPVKEKKARVDLTKKISFTIDPDTAKDYDDALSISKDKKGNYSLSVHIADVAHYVPPGTPLDKEALLRGNSTYLPGTCVPMLPEALSNELCSLKPNVIRLTASVLMRFDKTGTLLDYEIVRGFIKSAKRFTYGQAKEILDGKVKSPHKKALQLMVKLCELLKAKRRERGSIDFALPEHVIIIDKKGEPQGMQLVEYDITHQLVEEFMLKANEIVAISLGKKGKELVYRVHEAPQEENFNDFLQFARTLGFKITESPTATDLQHLFEEAKKTPFFSQLSIGFIRSMKLAQYSPENVGHYGLALEHYCHFTSPIRRYSDLVVQRLLFDEEPADLDMEEVAKRCSEQERISFRAETSVKTLKKLRLLEKYHKEDPERAFPAIVTKIKAFGLSFELEGIAFEGFLHISEIGNDYFIFDEKRALLLGTRTGKTYRIGASLNVYIKHIDLTLLEAGFSPSPFNASAPQKQRSRGRRRS